MLRLLVSTYLCLCVEMFSLWRGGGVRTLVGRGSVAGRRLHASVSSLPQQEVVGSSITLLAEEEELFTMFRTVVEQEQLGTTVRVAGGWVRDKLLRKLGKQDIDVALDNMTGAQFAMRLNQWSVAQGGQAIQFGVIQQNPDKSKHLETATAMLGKFEVDFVNLRTETYVDTSRIPEIQIGTPEEDALRRDLTINSLFFNVNTGLVEDFTGRGLHDLSLGLIQTPLPPLTTLQDDPLRALRAVRFACRFNFDMAAELWEACCHNTVREVLLTKVSRERVFQELEQMLDNAAAARASYMLHSLQLLPLIFTLPADSLRPVASSNAAPSPGGSGSMSFHEYGLSTLLGVSLLEMWAADSSAPSASDPAPAAAPFRDLLSRFRQAEDYRAERKLLNFAALCAQGVRWECANPQKKKKSLPLTDYLLQSELRMRGKDGDIVARTQQAAAQFKDLLRDLMHRNEAGAEQSLTRQALGGLMRRVGPSYMPALTLAAAELLVEAVGGGAYPEVLPGLCGLVQGGVERGGPDTMREPRLALFDQAAAARLLSAASLVVSAVDSMRLQHVYKNVPLLNGEAIKKIFSNIPKGPVFGEVSARSLADSISPSSPVTHNLYTKPPVFPLQIVEEQMNWMLVHPEGTAEELKGHITTKFAGFL